jgi:hypothetical protein
MCRGSSDVRFLEKPFIYSGLKFMTWLDAKILEFSHYDPFLQQSSPCSGKMSRI